MLSDFYRPGVALDFPKGGTQAIVAALVRGVTKHEGSHLHLNTHVSQLLIDEEVDAARHLCHTRCTDSAGRTVCGVHCVWPCPPPSCSRRRAR